MEKLARFHEGLEAFMHNRESVLAGIIFIIKLCIFILIIFIIILALSRGPSNTDRLRNKPR